MAEVGGGVADFSEGEDVGGLAFVEIADFFDQCDMTRNQRLVPRSMSNSPVPNLR